HTLDGDLALNKSAWKTTYIKLKILLGMFLKWQRVAQQPTEDILDLEKNKNFGRIYLYFIQI
ncbi:hypothetical protein ACJX0J_020015, partial [Zea mays]